MSLIDIVEKLSTNPRREEEEYILTSDFLEWFYYNVYREQGFIPYPPLRSITKEAEYDCIKELCKELINFNNAKALNDEALANRYENMKKWLLDMAQKYDQKHDQKHDYPHDPLPPQ